MNKRIYTLLNFIAFNLLFLALYLNFIYKDNQPVPVVVKHNIPANITIAHTEQRAAENNYQHTADRQASQNTGTAVKLSFN
jgi:hypothetical protein